ncbi:hypothetical protein [Mitsuokella multacida]|uniref:hypothetical protein n=1 Tax=Mitsuokella multacida TaxID=52226 RepID=UPI0026652AA0|nr:hypothetical protein [Mitsuokella multacida]
MEQDFFAVVPDSLASSTYIKERQDGKTGEVHREEKRLTCEHRLLLAKIVALSTYSPCSASNRFLAGYIGVQERQIKNLVGDLVRSGYIKIEGGTRSRLIFQTEKTYQLWQAIKRENVSLIRATDYPNSQDIRATDYPNNDGLGQSISSIRAIDCPQRSIGEIKKKEYRETTRHSEHSRKKKEFIPPSLDEVEQYVEEEGMVIDAKYFFDFYAAGEWHDSSGKPVKNWKQKALTWNRREQKERKSKPPASGPVVPTAADLERRESERQRQLDENMNELQERMKQEGEIEP